MSAPYQIGCQPISLQTVAKVIFTPGHNEEERLAPNWTNFCSKTRDDMERSRKCPVSCQKLTMLRTSVSRHRDCLK